MDGSDERARTDGSGGGREADDGTGNGNGSETDGDGEVADGDGRDSGADRSAKWRCAWCGRPHDRNDPPCDDCGHHKFERAVVPVAPEASGGEREPVWVCPNCGRTHQRNSPPCSRCGNPQLEKQVPTDEDFADELGGPSYADLLGPGYAAGFAVALVAAGVLALALLGVVTLPGTGGGDLAVENVPGSAETVEGVGLADVEAAYVEALNEQRAESGREPLARNDRLDAVARFANQRRVKSAYGDATTPSTRRLADEVGDVCGGSEVRYVRVDRRPGDAAFESADALAAVLVGAANEGSGPAPAAVEGTRTGVDVHTGPDGRVFLAQFIC